MYTNSSSFKMLYVIVGKMAGTKEKNRFNELAEKYTKEFPC